MGATNSGFQATFRVASYTQVTSLVNWIPLIGPLLTLYGVYLSIVGIREMHETTMGNDGQSCAGRTAAVHCGPVAGIAGSPCGRGGILQPKVAEGGF